MKKRNSPITDFERWHEHTNQELTGKYVSRIKLGKRADGSIAAYAANDIKVMIFQIISEKKIARDFGRWLSNLFIFCLVTRIGWRRYFESSNQHDDYIWKSKNSINWKKILKAADFFSDHYFWLFSQAANAFLAFNLLFDLLHIPFVVRKYPDPHFLFFKNLLTTNLINIWLLKRIWNHS